jgi:hypothetical protein
MELEIILAAVVDKWPIAASVAMGLGALVVLAEVVVLVTPSKSDDAKWAKIKAVPVFGKVLAFLASKAPIKKK